MTTEATLIERAWKDEAFREQLVSDPKSALRGVGQAVPDHLDIQVLEETGNTRYFVIPQNPNHSLEDALLSDDELDAVAGGWCSVVYCSFQKTQIT